MVKYLSLFSGIGAFEKALHRLGVPYELVGYCEIDPFASKAYSLLHGVPESMNYGGHYTAGRKKPAGRY